MVLYIFVRDGNEKMENAIAPAKELGAGAILAPEGPKRSSPSEKIWVGVPRTPRLAAHKPKTAPPGLQDPRDPPPGPEWFGVFRGGKEGLLRGNEVKLHTRLPPHRGDRRIF